MEIFEWRWSSLVFPMEQKVTCWLTDLHLCLHSHSAFSWRTCCNVGVTGHNPAVSYVHIYSYVWMSAWNLFLLCLGTIEHMVTKGDDWCIYVLSTSFSFSPLNFSKPVGSEWHRHPLTWLSIQHHGFGLFQDKPELYKAQDLMCQAAAFWGFLNCLHLMHFPFQAHSKWFAGLLITLSVGWNISTRSAAAVIAPEASSSTEPWGSTTSLRRRWSGTMPQIRARHRRFTTSAAMRKGTQSKKILWPWGVLIVEEELWSIVAWSQPHTFWEALFAQQNKRKPI